MKLTLNLAFFYLIRKPPQTKICGLMRKVDIIIVLYFLCIRNSWCAKPTSTWSVPLPHPWCKIAPIRAPRWL